MTDSLTTIDRLLAAGAPPATEPRFYRVKFDPNVDLDLRVEIRERRRRFGSDLLARRVVRIDPRNLDATLPAVVQALVDMTDDLTRASSVHDLLGDHKA